MIAILKHRLKSLLGYDALAETAATRTFLAGMQDESTGTPLPYVPPHQGDLIHLLIRRNGYVNCLETGFATGSTAVYMLAATKPVGGRVISIDNAQGGHDIAIGARCVANSGMAERHAFLAEDSSAVIRRLHGEGHQLDFVFLDGWKTFDHVAHELYLLDDMLSDGGAIVFDDTYMPAVRQTIQLLTTHYEYAEVDYAVYGQNWRTRLHLSQSSRTFHRPYRAFRKRRPTPAQNRKNDPYFHRRLR